MRYQWTGVLGLSVLALLVILPLGARADDQVRLEAALEGTAADPGAFGRARLDADGDRVRFEVRIEGITQAEVVFVVVGKHLLGMIELDDQGRGDLRLDTQDGHEIPLIRAGDAVGIFAVDDAFTLLACNELSEVK